MVLHRNYDLISTMAEELLTTKVMLEPIMFLLHICSCHPKREGYIIGKIILAIFIFFNIFWTIFIIIKIINNEDPLNVYISYIITTQVAAKAIQLHFYRKNLAKIIDVFCDKFWRSDEIPEHTKKYDKWHKRIYISLKIYRSILCCCIIFIFLFPLSHPVRALPLEFWFFDQNMHQTPYFQLLYIFQIITTALSYVLCLIPFDMLFIVFVGSSNIQFEMLKHKLKNITKDIDDDNEGEAFLRLKKAIEHHNLILQFLNDVEIYFSRILLKQYVDAVTCMGVYIYLQQQNFHLVYTFSLMTNMSQTLFYSLCGQTIKDQSLAVSDAAYESGWENIRNIKVKQGLVLIIQRAQRQVKITAGGVLDLSFETFVGMLKAAFSFLTVLRSTNRN